MSGAVTRIIQALESRGSHPRKSGSGWSARCPAHDDRDPSLTVSEGDDGRALVCCHAGCSHIAIAEALGLKEHELFENSERPTVFSHRKTRQKGGGKCFATWQAAMPKELGAPSRYWEYRDASGNMAGVSVRWDNEGGKKTFRPAALIDGAWQITAMPEPRPLYRLESVMQADDTIVVVEGEKCVDALVGLGIAATTSSMGAESAGKSDWSPLKSKQVVILPDNDKAGEKYAAEVTRLALAANAASVSVALLADHWAACPDGGDVADWIEAFGDAAEPAQMRKQLEKILAAAKPAESNACVSSTATRSLPAGAADVKSRPTRTDAGLCKRLCHVGAGRFLWISDRKTWVRWNGRRWVDDPDGGEPRRVAKTIGGELWAEAGPNASGEVVKFCRDAASRRGIDAAVALAKSEPGVEATADTFDTCPYEINCQNGILDLRTMALRRHDPSARMSKLAAVAFDANAQCPRWQRFISEVMLGDEEMIAYLQRSLGLALSGDVSEQICWCHWGEGCNGKSLLFSVLSQILGDYAAPIPADILVTTAGERDREKSVARLVGNRLCFAQEPDDGGKLAEGSLKAITGGDQLTSRVEYERARKVTPTWHVHVCMNRLPQVRGTDYGLWRRLHVVRWGRIFGPEEQRPRCEMERELLAEAPGILNWLCAGFNDWRQGGLRPPPAVAGWTERYRQFSDSVSRWLASDEVEREDGSEVPASELYTAYCRFCEEEGCSAVTLTMFGRNLEGRGITKSRPKAGEYRDMVLRVGLRLRVSHARLLEAGA
mgnify:CR=1 FL=1